MKEKGPVVFVHLGRKLPSYIPFSLRLAARHSGLRPVLITSRQHFSVLEGTETQLIGLEDFYIREDFFEARKRVTFSHEFRDGFWLSAVERFFVLEQFMRRFKWESLFHAELDQLLFDCNQLVLGLQEAKVEGIAFPFHSPVKAVASVFYCDRIEVLGSFLEMASQGEGFKNEMELLVRYSRQFPERVVAIPTIADEMLESEKKVATPSRTIDSKLLGGVVDAAELGLWVGGRDPRNLSLLDRPSNHFVYPGQQATLSPSFLKSLQFEILSGRMYVSESVRDSRFRLFNLHLHSKLHKFFWLRDPDLRELLATANLKKDSHLVGSRRIQMREFLAKRVLKKFLL